MLVGILDLFQNLNAMELHPFRFVFRQNLESRNIAGRILNSIQNPKKLNFGYN